MSKLKEFIVNEEKNLIDKKMEHLEKGNIEDAYNVQGKMDLLQQVKDICEKRGRF